MVVAVEATKTARAGASAVRASAVAAAALSMVVLVLKGRERRSWSNAAVRDRAGDLEAERPAPTPVITDLARETTPRPSGGFGRKGV